MNVTNNEVYPKENDEHYLKILLAKIEHNLKEVVVSNNPSTNKGQKVYFHSSEGLPINLSIESSLVLIIRCKHEKLHKFNIPIESVTEWKIVNGTKHGAFKHGFGLKAKYSDNYKNANCVLYYPPREGFSMNSRSKQTTSEIKINLKVNIANKEILENSMRKNSSSSHQNDIEISNYCDREFLLTLLLRQDKGFLKKRFYEVLFLSYEEILNKNKELENTNNLIHVIDEDKSLGNFSYSCTHITDSSKIIYSTSSNSEQSCGLCKLIITFELPQLDIYSKLKIDLNIDRLFTSEYITISDNYHSYAKYDNYENEGNFIVFAVKSDSELLEFRIIDCPTIMVFQTFWEVTAGFISYNNTGHSVTYRTSNEGERSKSPVTLSLYKRDIFSESKNIELPYLLDQKKIWLLRRMIFGG